MGGQAIERREILRYIGIASVAAAFPGFRNWSFVCAHESPLVRPSQVASQPYKPLFFSAEQFQLVEHLSEMILPADDTPGAKAAGVGEFIDFMVANRVPVTISDPPRSVKDGLLFGDQIQVQFLGGLDWLNAHATAGFGHPFLECTPQQQTSILEELAYQAKFKPITQYGREFFQLMRDYTVVGYYTTKIGLESLGYPGLRTVWPSAPGCSHPDDPEHAHLQDARKANQVAPGFAHEEGVFRGDKSV
jgi:gluconate 2-dehydrogenase gamma chain